MGRTKSSDGWMREHFDDIYVKKAQQEGYRSRAVYKLLELNDKDRLLRPGMTVVDLGAAPGGWTQVAAQLVGDHGHVVALDILPMDNIAGVDIITGDFREDDVLEQLLKTLGESPVDLVMSDMAPNMSGNKAVDIPGAMYLVELAVDLAEQVLKKDGDLVMKVFQGEGFDELVKGLRKHYKKVVIRKPKASRPRSKEVYVLARGHIVV
ncbi:MAG: 23S rRNA (uridine(2552)-2'-O)-methyltransferase RlmE [Gammaproteobacteria bacterium]|nr:23S rRNA (uridine(2552)-2'-O)-methyltransferase RlmE [Gammaproteobacteria bacterium]